MESIGNVICINMLMKHENELKSEHEHEYET